MLNSINTPEDDRHCLLGTFRMEVDFFKSALVDAVIPEDTVAEVSEILQAAAEQEPGSHRLLAVKERELLFFGTSNHRA